MVYVIRERRLGVMFFSSCKALGGVMVVAEVVKWKKVVIPDLFHVLVLYMNFFFFWYGIIGYVVVLQILLHLMIFEGHWKYMC